MESSIAVFLMRQLACEQLPTICGSASCGGSTAARLQRCPPAHVPVPICSHRWLVEQAGLAASPRGWGVGHQLVIPSRPFGYDQV